jgi:hypothetical protein
MSESSIDANWWRWRNELETLRIMMGASESSCFFSHIVTTSRVNVQCGVSHEALWTKARKSFHGMEIHFLRTTGWLLIFLGSHERQMADALIEAYLWSIADILSFVSERL